MMYVPTALPASTEYGLRRHSDRLLANCFLVSLVFHVALGAFLARLRWSRPEPPRFTEVRLIHRAPSAPLRAGRRLPPQAPRVAARPRHLSLYLHDKQAAPRRRARRGRRSRQARPAPPMLASRPEDRPGDLGGGGEGVTTAPPVGPIAAGGAAASGVPVPGGERPGRRGRARSTGDGSPRPRARRLAWSSRPHRDIPTDRRLAASGATAARRPSPGLPDLPPAAPRERTTPERPQPIRLARRPSLRAEEPMPARTGGEPDVAMAAHSSAAPPPSALPMVPGRAETEPVARRVPAPSGDERLARLPEHLPSQDAAPDVVTGPDSSPDRVETAAEPAPVRVRAQRQERREPELDPRVSSGRGAAADEALPGPALATSVSDEQPGDRDVFRAGRRGSSRQGRRVPGGVASRRSGADGGPAAGPSSGTRVPDLRGDRTGDSGPAARDGAASTAGGAAKGGGAAGGPVDEGPQRFGRRAGARGGGDGAEGAGDPGTGPGKARRGDGTGDEDGEGDLGQPGGGGRGEGDGGPGSDGGGPGGAGGRGLPAKPEAGGVYVSTTGRYLLPGAVTGSDYMFHVNALNKILDEINSRTRLRVRLGRQYLRIRPGGFRRAPVVVFTGHRAFQLNDEQRLALRQYVEGGGMIWADLANAPFDDSFRDEMERIFGRRPTPLGAGHTLYRSFYVLNGIPAGDLGGAAPFEGIAVGDRLGVVITPNRYFGAVTGPPHVTEEVQEGAFRVAVNIYVYAAAHYRAEQDD